MVAAGIAASAVQIALAGDAGNQEGWDMLARVLGLAALFGCCLAGSGKFEHKGSLTRILEGGLQSIRHDVLHALCHISLNVKAFVDSVHFVCLFSAQALLNFSFGCLQRGHIQSSGRSSNAAPSCSAGS